MIQKTVTIRDLHQSSAQHDLTFWRNRDASERISAVESLRRQTHGSSTRLQRTVCIIQQAQD